MIKWAVREDGDIWLESLGEHGYWLAGVKEDRSLFNTKEEAKKALKIRDEVTGNTGRGKITYVKVHV